MNFADAMAAVYRGERVTLPEHPYYYIQSVSPVVFNAEGEYRLDRFLVIDHPDGSGEVPAALSDDAVLSEDWQIVTQSTD